MRTPTSLPFVIAMLSTPACDAKLPETLAAPSASVASQATSSVQEPPRPLPVDPAQALGQAPRGLAIALGAPRLIAQAVVSSRSMLVQAVYQASELSGAGANGGVTSTGTLTVSEAGAQYAPSPADKLIVVLGKERHEFVLEAVQGNTQALDPWTWMASPHALRYQHAASKHAQAAVELKFDGVNFEAKIKGFAPFGGERVALEIAAKGRTQGEKDAHGQDVTTVYALSGKLSGSEFEVDVDEQHSMRTVASTSLRLLHSMRGSATSVQSQIASRLQIGADRYGFEGLIVHSDYAEKGGQVKNQETKLSGTVTLNGKPFGACSIEGGVPIVTTAAGPLMLRL